MTRIMDIHNQIEELTHESIEIYRKQKELEESIDFPYFKSIEFTFQYPLPFITVRDNTLRAKQELSELEQKGNLFIIDSNYNIKNLTKHFQTLENHKKILKETKKWCKTAKKLEKLFKEEEK